MAVHLCLQLPILLLPRDILRPYFSVIKLPVTVTCVLVTLKLIWPEREKKKKRKKEGRKAKREEGRKTGKEVRK